MGLCVWESRPGAQHLPGASPEGPVPGSGGAAEAEGNAERTAQPAEASAPAVPIEPRSPEPTAAHSRSGRRPWSPRPG